MLSLRRFAVLPLLLGAGPAYAHAPIPGIKGFYLGLLHPFSTPSQALLMLGLGLMLGGFTFEKLGSLWGSFLVSSFLGLFVGTGNLDLDVAMFALAFVACATAALLPGRIVAVVIALVAVGGVFIGSASIPDDGPTRDRILAMSGAIVGANIGLLYIFGIVRVIRERFTWGWVEIAFRIAAAWLGAIALLMLAIGMAEVEFTS